MSGRMAAHECMCVLCSKSLLQVNERYRLVDRIKTDTLTPPRTKVLTEVRISSNIEAMYCILLTSHTQWGG